MSNLIIAESFKRFFELNSSKSKVAKLLLEDVYTATDFANYIARRGDMVSFLPAGKEHVVNEDTGDWKRENRQTIRAGKLARKLITEEGYNAYDLKDVDFELFSNLIKSETVNDEDCQVSFKEVSGEDIRYRYHEDNHSTTYKLGSLDDSCMRYDKAQDWLDIYVKNPDTISLLVMVDSDDRTVGRAIVWKTDKGIFMDRVYASDAHQKMFEHYAENKGWMYKIQHSNENYCRIVTNGNRDDAEYMYFSVKLEDPEFDYYPYMDTLCYLNPNSGIISNNDSYKVYELRQTGGEGHQGVWDEYNEEYIDEDDAVYIDNYGYVHMDNTTWDNYADENILDSDAIQLDNGKWCHKDNAIEVDGYGWHHKDNMDDFVQIDDSWYHIDDVCYDDLNECDIPRANAVELQSGGYTDESNDIVRLDDSYGNDLYAPTDNCKKCVYSNEWFLEEDTTITYSGAIVASVNLDAFLEKHEEEIVPAPNQLTLEIIDNG